MPKIVIREFDNTTAGGAAYANFAVVVPGFVADDKLSNWVGAAKVCDDNGVYECSNREDFEKNVGLTSSINHKVADAKIPTWDDSWEDVAELTEAEFNTHVATGKLYLVTANTTVETGYLKDSQYIYVAATAEKKSEYTFKAAPVAETPADGGQTDSTEPQTASEGDGTTEVVYSKFMLLEDTGHNDLYEAHYGNQIAWELLGLGYTVLYKRIESTTYLSQAEFWKPLKDKTLYDFRYLMSGLLDGNQAVYSNMVGVAAFDPENKEFDKVDPLVQGRGDCIALLDIDEDVYKGLNQESAINGILEFSSRNVPTSKYAAAFVPSVKYSRVDNEDKFGNNRWFPASFHYLACAARSSEHFNEWYANAGYSRGISKYNIEQASCNFGEAAVNMFQRRSQDTANKAIMAINPIIKLRGTYYIWGNRTTHPLGAEGTDNGDLVASHFLNIRQLCSTIKKEVYVTCRQNTFNPNSDSLWVKFCNSIKPTLEKMKADQGIEDYKIMKVKSNRKAFLSAVIRIVPIEAVEDFEINVYLEDSLNGAVAATEE